MKTPIDYEHIPVVEMKSSPPVKKEDLVNLSRVAIKMRLLAELDELEARIG